MTTLALHLLTLGAILAPPALDRWIAFRYHLSTRWSPK